MTSPVPIDRAALELAICNWLKNSSGVPNVASARQRMPQLKYPLITYQIDEAGAIGGDDEIRYSATMAPASPAEDTTQLVCGLRRMLVSVNVYADAKDPSKDARALMDLVFVALSLPSQAFAFEQSGIAIVERGTPRSLDRVEETAWISRVQLDVTICVASNAVEKIGSIGTVEITQTGEDPKWNPATQTFSVDN